MSETNLNHDKIPEGTIFSEDILRTIWNETIVPFEMIVDLFYPAYQRKDINQKWNDMKKIIPQASPEVLLSFELIPNHPNEFKGRLNNITFHVTCTETKITCVPILNECKDKCVEMRYAIIKRKDKTSIIAEGCKIAKS